MLDKAFIQRLAEKVLEGYKIGFDEAQRLLFTKEFTALTECANTITRENCGEVVDVEVLINAKSGGCPEDCSFCSQSSFYYTDIHKYPLLSSEVIVERAKRAKESGSKSFCLVGAYRTPSDIDFDKICESIVQVKSKVGIDVNVSLGFMTMDRVRKLKAAGVKRYNHNLETCQSLFSTICKTHHYQDRINTARIVKQGGLELCCGGIIGLGESPLQRLELGFSIASLDPDEVPVNILISKKGTPLFNLTPLHPEDAIRIISIWRFIMPKTIIKIAGGREVHLKDQERLALNAGANGIITGGYLTSGGNSAEKDILTIKEIGLKS
jgi:biotin synthase